MDAEVQTVKPERKKRAWVIQVALPWMTSGVDDSDEQARRKRAPKFGKSCARAIAERFLTELGQGAKVRIYCPETGEYAAMLLSENAEEGIKTYNGRENRDGK